MMEQGIVDGSNIDQPTDRQLDELNQSECDLLTISDDDWDTLLSVLK